MESFISLTSSINCSPVSEPPDSGGTDDASLPARQSAAGWISAKSLSSSSTSSVYSSLFSSFQDETDAPRQTIYKSFKVKSPQNGRKYPHSQYVVSRKVYSLLLSMKSDYLQKLPFFVPFPFHPIAIH